MSSVPALLRRDSAVVVAALATLTLLAWWYVWRGAGMGMSAMDMTMLAFFPHKQLEPMAGMTPPPYIWLVSLTMWWVMMVAMMTPSAAPLVLLYSRVQQHSIRHATGVGATNNSYASPLLLVGGYLIAWLGFSLLATALQYGLQRVELISPMMLWSKSAVLSAAVLVSAGLYQYSPFKRACLRHCRGPVDFLLRHARPGRAGAFIMGLEHGSWCIGCCWMLMLLLFIGGVMNLVWIALLTLLVLVEKLVPGGPAITRLSGAVLIVWGLMTLVV